MKRSASLSNVRTFARRRIDLGNTRSRDAASALGQCPTFATPVEWRRGVECDCSDDAPLSLKIPIGVTTEIYLCSLCSFKSNKSQYYNMEAVISKLDDLKL